MGSAECMSLFSLIRWQNSRLDIPSCEPSSDVGAPLWAVITEKYKKKIDSEVTWQDFRKRSRLLNAKSTDHREIREGLLFVTRPFLFTCLLRQNLIWSTAGTESFGCMLYRDFKTTILFTPLHSDSLAMNCMLVKIQKPWLKDVGFSLWNKQKSAIPKLPSSQTLKEEFLLSVSLYAFQVPHQGREKFRMSASCWRKAWLASEVTEPHHKNTAVEQSVQFQAVCFSCREIERTA